MAVTSDELEQAEKWLLKQLSKGARRLRPLVAQGVAGGLNLAAVCETVRRSDRFKVSKWRKEMWLETVENDPN